MKKGLPEARAVPNDREGVPTKGVILFFRVVNASDNSLIGERFGDNRKA